jgi:collagenase-like PrtC family protease
MAPVGSYESLTAAAQAGADSVILSGGFDYAFKFLAKFRIDDLAKIVAF